VEIRPPIPFPTARFDQLRRDAQRPDGELEDWVWAMRLEEELDYAMLERDTAAMRRQRLVGWVRVVALVAVVASLVVVIRAASAYGLGVGIVGVWALPVVVLAVVLCAEKLLLRFTH
jgi:hypothetical protein